ncbi:hypothetical protein OIDMADRAFT_18789 [Oidiodendron maius Zn]|uniref:Uncharacterized protein n=1 Tax=Oidiodendron maius (strain Zn) TaxID=913774 RepID=A0A0C3CSP4_OIDMZ|nr:hypothetical protein OIDMADRAFT_18789 [Oidiodendron maius Zn]
MQLAQSSHSRKKYCKTQVTLVKAQQRPAKTAAAWCFQSRSLHCAADCNDVHSEMNDSVSCRRCSVTTARYRQQQKTLRFRTTLLETEIIGTLKFLRQCHPSYLGTNCELTTQTGRPMQFFSLVPNPP